MEAAGWADDTGQPPEELMKTSIVITAYNYARYIERSIRSCLNQQLIEPGTNEVIVVDDGSQDDTLAVLEKFKRLPNFHVIANRDNVGVAEASNMGIRESLGQYVVRVDADDYVSDKFIFFLRSYLEVNHDAFGVSCDYMLVDEHEKSLERCYAEQRPISCGILYQRDLLVRAGLYNPEFRHREEEELRRRLGDYYRLHHLRMPLYRYRMHNHNKTKEKEYHVVGHQLAELYDAEVHSATWTDQAASDPS
jgi:glycosyltransferase involved in cell wall biosynthesis